VYYIEKLTKSSISYVLVAFMMLPAVSFAADAKKGIDKKDVEKVQAAIRKIIPKSIISAKDIRQSPLPNFYEVTYFTYVYYISKDGRYLIDGNLLDLNTRKNLTTPRVLAARMNTLNSIGEEKMIIFSPPANKVKHTITVFTDIDCPYCRLMHNQIDQYMKLGIKVRYMLFPRAQANTPTYKKAIAVWCSKDRNAALTRAKAGKTLSPGKCDHPIAEHVQIGSAMGVTGTPSIISSSGQVIPGFVAAKELEAILNKKLTVKK